MKKDRVLLHCQACSIAYEVPRYKEFTSKYCSQQCHYESKKGKPSHRKGKKHTAESKLKMSIAQTGKPSPTKGKPMSEDTKKKLSAARKGKPSPNKGKKCPEEVKRRISEANTGRKWSDEQKHKMSQDRRGKFIGDKHWNWQGGICDKPYTDDFVYIRAEIYKRDNFTCQLCGVICTSKKRKDTKKHICCHHINYNKQDNDLHNLIVLCATCHGKTNVSKGEWQQHFIQDKYNEIN